ncbi:MAG: hypothetical protein ACK6AD_14080 [Cyanobacteriota bacterium]|jgi:hypothetical protein
MSVQQLIQKLIQISGEAITAAELLLAGQTWMMGSSPLGMAEMAGAAMEGSCKKICTAGSINHRNKHS